MTELHNTIISVFFIYVFDNAKLSSSRGCRLTNNGRPDLQLILAQEQPILFHKLSFNPAEKVVQHNPRLVSARAWRLALARAVIHGTTISTVSLAGAWPASLAAMT